MRSPGVADDIVRDVFLRVHAGFEDVWMREKADSRCIIGGRRPGQKLEEYIVLGMIEARKLMTRGPGATRA